MTPAIIRVVTILEAGSVTGPAKCVLEFVREARSTSTVQIELSVVTFVRGPVENEFIRRVRAEGIPIDLIHERSRFDRGTIARLRKVIRDRNPDVLWTNAVKSHFLVRASGLHRRTPWIAFHHGYTTTDWTTRLYNQLDRWSLHDAGLVVTVCEAFARRIEQLGIDRARIRVQHMPIRPSDQQSPGVGAAVRRCLQIQPDELVLLNVGRFSKEKGHAELLRAIAQTHRNHPTLRLRLILVGDGPDGARLRALCTTLEIEPLVTFAGYQSDVREYFAAADVFVLPSHSEGSPNVLLEAIDADVPIVATAVGGIPEMVTNEVDALLVPGLDVGALSEAIGRILLDESLRVQLRTTARLRLSQHTPEAFFGNIAEVLREASDASK